jgi:poly-gamma-glutamate synthesis protein (capsule biosynthesis protein)
VKYLWLVLFVIFIFSCGHVEPSRSFEIETPNFPEVSEEAEQREEEKKPPRYSVTLLAAGDNLFHGTIVSSFKDTKKNTYDFTPIYSEIKSLVEKVDLAFINQETVMAGEKFGYSDYPRFNTPQELAMNLAQTGFNIVNHANNHAMDMNQEGLLATLDLWDTIQGITVLGARRSGDKHRIIVKNNITFGFLSYTYGLNGFTLPAGNPDLVSLINRTAMAADIDALRPLCDFLIVSMHWGDEYIMEPGSYQTGLAAFLAEHNVDLVIGHHPHVLQRFESLPRPDGKNTLCFYSLGNFVSHQRQKERILGALLCVTFVKENDELSIVDSGLIPVVCHYDQNFSNTKVYPLYSYNEELLNKHRARISDKNLTMEFIHSVMNGLKTKVYTQDPF